jgi:Peptidase family M1 domain
MRHILRHTSVAAALLLGTAGAAPAQLPADSAALSAWIQGFRTIGPDPGRGAQVSGLTLERPSGTLRLESGSLHLLEPLGGRTLGAVFVGQGSFTVRAPISVEQAQLEREYGSPEPTLPIKRAVLFFTDSTESELARSVVFAARTPPKDAAREVEEAFKYVSDDEGWLARDILLPLLGEREGFFYAHVAEDRGDPLIYEISPFAAEDVSISKRTRRGQRRRVVAQFAADGGTHRQEDLDLIRIASYDIETTVDDGLDLAGRAIAHIDPDHTHPGWVPFRLHPALDLDSVRGPGGDPLEYYRAKEHTDVWVRLGSVPDSSDVSFFYHGDFMDRPRDLWIQFRSHNSWFPVYEPSRPIRYRLTYHTPSKFVVSSVGVQIEEDGSGPLRTTVWEAPEVYQVTFNLGDFDELVRGNLRVHANERAHRTLGALAAEANVFLLEQKDMAEMVAQDLSRSLGFYKGTFGPTPVTDFVATEIPFSHGQAFPGLVLLSWTTFQWTSEKGFDEMFRAHEVAHQWWGIGVRPASYHDQWLAEGFSEFSGLWYAARVRGSVEMYRRRLDETRDALIERRGEAGPIWLGPRVASSEHPEDHQMVIYQKGAWVLHMLRMLLTDLDTGNDDVFVDVMQTFYRTYLGKAASTEDFRATIESRVGADMGWFFDNWVYGADIPTYTFSHKYETLADGTVKATVRVRQEGVPDDFSMIVPIKLDFGAEGSATVRLNVVGPVTEAELPLLPRQPDTMEFNAFQAVLAEVKTEGWKN